MKSVNLEENDCTVFDGLCLRRYILALLSIFGTHNRESKVLRFKVEGSKVQCLEIRCLMSGV